MPLLVIFADDETEEHGEGMKVFRLRRSFKRPEFPATS